MPTAVDLFFVEINPNSLPAEVISRDGAIVAADNSRCQLYLVIEAGIAAPEQCAAALAVADIACLLIEPAPGAPLDAGGAEPLVRLAQQKDVAAIIAADAHLARTLKADGVHLPPSPDPAKTYADVRRILGPRCIVGADAGKSRHDAMVLGEAGPTTSALAFPGTSRISTALAPAGSTL